MLWSTKKQPLIDPDWIKQHEPTGFTYDMWKLQRYARQPLFVYDQWMQTHRMHSMIHSWSQFRGTAFTANDNWIMWKKRLGQGTFPIPMRMPSIGIETGRISGELYLIDSGRIKVLDEYKENGVEFRRKSVEVLIPYRHKILFVNKDHNYQWRITELITKVNAWMYIGRHKYWQEFLDAGYSFGTCKLHDPQGTLLTGKYYSFSKLDLDDG
jgi:gamma-glutamylcyclotransferase (GGCT)/AIG2-like uncharacterized protein YtfP